MTKQELGQKIKAKYPQYKGMDDVELADRIIAKYPVYQQQITEAAPKSGLNGFIPGVVNAAKERFQNVKESFRRSGDDLINNKKNLFQKQNQVETGFQTVGNMAGFAGDVGMEAVKAVLPEAVKKPIKNALAAVMTTKPAQKIVEKIDEFKKNNPRMAANAGAAVNIASLFPVGKGANVAEKAALKSAEKVANFSDKTAGLAINTAKKVMPSAKTVNAVTQTGGELIERLPRAFNRAKDAIQKSGERAIRIKQSDPVVANAIKTNLDERFINTINEADNATKKAYRQVVDIAEENPKTIGMKKQPSIVSGELASKQYDIINQEKKAVGKQLGDEVKQLSKTEKVDMTDGLITADETLKSQGIKLKYTKKGTILDFSGTNFTPAERTKIQQLYNLANEGNLSMTPAQIRAKDSLFSKLQRESNLEGIGKIMIETQDGPKSLFSVFRDIYSQKLDDISPVIRTLNKKYRDLSLITEDIEDSILRTPNFNITKTADPAEFAKVNLRRIFGEAQSSPVFEAIADQMDALARQLGYSDASPKKIAEFAQELRKLYPETIPKTGFSGGISSGLTGVLGKAAVAVFRSGMPNLKDQRAALKELIEARLRIK